MSSLNIVFAGTPEFGLPCLDVLISSSHRLSAIYTQPDRPAGRGRKVQASAVKEWALAHNIPVIQPLNFKTSEAIEELALLKPDVLVVIAYGLILPRAVLEIPRLGCINVHASLLPRWRGASPIQQAILQGDEQSGITIMQMDVGMDTGAMLRKVACPINSTDTAASLHDKLAKLSAKPLLDTLDDLSKDRIYPEVQNNELATYAGKISKEEAQVDWNDSALEIDRKVRAFYPWPIAYTQLGEEMIRIHQASIVAMNCTELPGTILTLDKKGLLVATGEQGLMISKIQFPGGKALSIADWLNAGKSQLYPGLVLK
jgi:methionyl-tRNA formyltransferase